MVEALKTQIGGDHYKKLSIQPWQYIQENNLSFLQGCVVKYVTRYKDKNGKQDLEKAIHCLRAIIDFEYKENHLD